jgi:hypothetical protein
MNGIKQGANCGLTSWGKTLTVLVVAVWIFVFLAGILVNSAPYRARISQGLGGGGFGQLLKVWLVVFLVYTPTNVAILSLLMGLLGALGRCATLSVDEESDQESERDTINPYLSGVLRGFIVYLLTIAGLIVVLEQAPLSPTGPEQYIRLASVISVTGFIVGYNPKYFGKLLNRARQTIGARKKAAGGQPGE